MERRNAYAASLNGYAYPYEYEYAGANRYANAYGNAHGDANCNAHITANRPATVDNSHRLPLAHNYPRLSNICVL